MGAVKIATLVALLGVAVSAIPNSQNSIGNNLKPAQWVSPAQLENIPSLDEISWQQLENMNAEDGGDLMQQFYHLARINHNLKPTFVPSPSSVPVSITKKNGEFVNANLNTLASTAANQQNFGEQEVTIFITGLPSQMQSVAKTNGKLIEAYKQRYNQWSQQKNQQQNNQFGNNDRRSSSEEDYNNQGNNQNQNQQNKQSGGDLIVIDLGSTLTNMKRYAMLDVQQTGAIIGNVLVQLTNEARVPQEIIHIVAQGIGAQVAGEAARQFTRQTGNKLRRITALDAARVIASNPKALTGLARGDAEFVDAIHTSAHGMGTDKRVGDADFYPNGPSTAAPGANNAIEAAMLATRYYAETVRPGNERNFPAVQANSFEQYKNNNGNGPRTYMGIATKADAEGDFMLQVNSKAPFGQRSPAKAQKNYHGRHQLNNNNYNYNGQNNFQ